MKVPFVDLRAQYLSIKEQIDVSVFKVIEETAFIGGKYVQEFEEEFSQLYGVKHCISVANGTDSLYILMKMLEIGAGDEVITVANSWISSSETISQTGARPVFVDINPDYYTIDETLLEQAITSRTKAILPVHLFGQMCNMEVILKVANKYGIPVLEDCAQSHFSEFEGKRAGTIGLAGSFSFYPGKNLGAYGDAGCIITDNDELALKCRMYARHGALKKHEHLIEGINSRMDGLQAAILMAKLPFILNWTELRRAHAKTYDELLGDLTEHLSCPKVRSSTLHSFHLYVIRTKKRNELMSFLAEKGIETAIHYPTALPNLPAYRYLGYKLDDIPIASRTQNEILSLPMFPEMTMEQIEYVTDTIKQFFRAC